MITFSDISVLTALNLCGVMILHNRVSLCLSFNHNMLGYKVPHGSPPMLHSAITCTKENL